MSKFFFILIPIVFSSCKNSCDVSQITESKTVSSNSITLIFQARNDVQYSKSMFYNKLSYTEIGGFIPKELSLSNWNKPDTLKLNTNSNISLFYNYRSDKSFGESFDYLLNKGDTVVFEYSKGTPYAKVLNRKAKVLDLNFYADSGLKRPLEDLQFHIKNQRFRNKNEKKQYKKDEAHFFSAISNQLDSLREGDLISEDVYTLHKNRYKYLQINLNSKDFDFDNVPNTDLINDPMLCLGAYRYFLENYIINKYNIKLLKEKDPFSFDAIAAFDAANNDERLSEKVKNYLLFKYLESIAASGTTSDLTNYSTRFKNTVKDTSLIRYVSDKYLLDLIDLKKETKNVYFIDYSKKRRTLENILETNKGKVIYIDFWASWCAPCRVLMPASKELHKSYENKEVVFIYISTDTDFDKWQEANKQEGLPHNQFSLLAVNYPQADFYKEMSLSVIPRYLLFDRQGKIASKKAPNPDTEQIKEELDKLLSK